MLVAAWPLHGLELRGQDLLLRPMRDEDALAVARIVHGLFPDPRHRHFMPNLVRGALRDDLVATSRNVLTWNWGRRAALGPEDWEVPFAVLRDGEVVGMQALSGQAFGVTREVGSGSYVDPARQGQGIGTRMRAIVLEFAFGWLEAQCAVSGHMLDNLASASVSAKLGYEPDGVRLWSFEGSCLQEQRLRLGRQRWQEVRPAWLDSMAATGVAGVRPLLGATP